MEHQLIIKMQGSISVTHNYQAEYETDHPNDFAVVYRNENSPSAKAGQALQRPAPGCCLTEIPTSSTAVLPSLGLSAFPLNVN